MAKRRLPLAVLLLALALTPALASAQTGTITGTVTGEGVGPLNGVHLDFFNQSNFFESALTDASGVYTVDLPPGSYKVVTGQPPQWAGEVYPNVHCFGRCSDPLFTPGSFVVTVTASNTTAGIDFALEPAGSISGTVIDAATMDPIPVTVIHVYGDSGSELNATFALNGAFTLSDLPARTYRVAAEAVFPYFSEVYDDLSCGPDPCTASMAATGTPVVLASGQNLTGIDFALHQGGSITGTVTNAGTGAPLSQYPYACSGPTGHWPTPSRPARRACIRSAGW